MPRALTSNFAAMAACATLLLVPGPFTGKASAQPDNAQIRSHKERAPHRTARQAQPQRYQRGDRTARPYVRGHAGKRLIGSAADVRSRHYQRYFNQPQVSQPAPPVHHGGHGGHYNGGYYGAPYVVYIDSTPREPQVVQEPPPRAYEPPPIYVVQPQAAPVQPAPAAPTWQQPPTAPAAPPAPVAPRRERSTDPQPVSVSVQPSDALVYLDGELIGAAGSISQLDLPPGVYVLEIEHAEMAGQRLVFGVDEEPLSVGVDLTADRPSRRSRVK